MLWWWLSFLFTVFSVSLATETDPDCPPSLLTQPCECGTSRRGGTTLKCKNITNKEILDRTFRRTSHIPFQTFSLLRSSIENLPAAHLTNYTFVQISETNLTTLFDSPPNPNNRLDSIVLDLVKFSGEFPWVQFANLKRLRYISLWKVDIPILDTAFTTHVNKGLGELIFDTTNTSLLAEGVFSGFLSLETVWITKTHLKELKRSHFPTPTVLSRIILGDNQISSLSGDAFSDMPSLRQLELWNNQVSFVSESAFGGVYEQLDELDLGGNPIRCDCTMQWIASRRKPKESYAYCKSPQNVYNKPISDLQEADFNSCHYQKVTDIHAFFYIKFKFYVTFIALINLVLIILVAVVWLPAKKKYSSIFCSFRI